MIQTEINQAVAETTGESVETIASIGFSLESPPDEMLNPLPVLEKPNTIDVQKAIQQECACPAA